MDEMFAHAMHLKRVNSRKKQLVEHKYINKNSTISKTKSIRTQLHKAKQNKRKEEIKKGRKKKSLREKDENHNLWELITNISAFLVHFFSIKTILKDNLNKIQTIYI